MKRNLSVLVLGVLTFAGVFVAGQASAGKWVLAATGGEDFACAVPEGTSSTFSLMVVARLRR